MGEGTRELQQIDLYCGLQTKASVGSPQGYPRVTKAALREGKMVTATLTDLTARLPPESFIFNACSVPRGSTMTSSLQVRKLGSRAMKLFAPTSLLWVRDLNLDVERPEAALCRAVLFVRLSCDHPSPGGPLN